MTGWSALSTKYNPLETFAGRVTAPCGSGIVQGLDVRLPLLLVYPRHTSVICNQAIDFALDISSLSPHTSTAREQSDLILQLAEKNVATVVPRLNGGINLVSLIDGVDGCLVVP